MKPSVEIRPAADRDLDAHAEYLASAAGPEVALRFYDAASATFEDLARMPGMGERRDPSNPSLAGLRVRSIARFESLLVFYRAIEGGIEVVRVLHAARDLDRILADEAR